MSTRFAIPRPGGVVPSAQGRDRGFWDSMLPSLGCQERKQAWTTPRLFFFVLRELRRYESRLGAGADTQPSPSSRFTRAASREVYQETFEVVYLPGQRE